MNVKDFLLSVEREDLKERFMGRSEWGMMPGTLERNLATFFKCISEIEPIEAEIVMLFCEGNEPLVKFFEYQDLEALHDPECELLHLVPERLFGDELEKVCRKWGQMKSYRAERMPWQVENHVQLL